MIFEDEVSFRQDPTMYQTWAKLGCQPLIPTTGQRKCLKYFGSIEIYSGRFIYKCAEVFNAYTYLSYLEKLIRSYYPRKIYYIQDNASYHKDSRVWDWFSYNRKNIEVYNLPPYSPELNAIERLWHYIRINTTHNRYFKTIDELKSSLMSTFRSMQRKPAHIYGYIRPFT